MAKESKKKPFDPEGSGYDYESAKSGGLKRDKNKHLGSRNPKTGQMLKGKQHKTWHLAEKGEKEAGYEIYKGKDGKYYSHKPSEVRVKKVKSRANPLTSKVTRSKKRK